MKPGLNLRGSQFYKNKFWEAKTIKKEEKKKHVEIIYKKTH